MKSGCSVVDRVGEFEIKGNIIPPLWYKNITFPSSKAHFVAITLLADILYWYRPTLVRDESGNIIGTRTKFKGNMLQKSYQAFADIYGFTKRQVKDAIDFLVDHHLLLREFRTISSSSMILNNVMYIQPVAENIQKIIETRCYVDQLVSICSLPTTECMKDVSSNEGPSLSEEGTPSVERKTYTESTSNSTSERKKDNNNDNAGGSAMEFYVKNGFGQIGSYIKNKIQSWCRKLSDELVVEVMKKAVDQGKGHWRYVEAILKNRVDAGVKSLGGIFRVDMEFENKKKRKRSGQAKLPNTFMEKEPKPDWDHIEGERANIKVELAKELNEIS